MTLDNVYTSKETEAMRQADDQRYHILCINVKRNLSKRFTLCICIDSLQFDHSLQIHLPPTAVPSVGYAQNAINATMAFRSQFTVYWSACDRYVTWSCYRFLLNL